MSAAECVMTHSCERSAARRMSRPSAGMRSGCRLVSGSFSTMTSGGRGVSRATTHRM
jgi:hypothetical protein